GERFRVVQTRGLSRQALAAVLAAHDRALATGEGVHKNQPRTAVTRVRVGGEAFAVKEYRGGLLERLKKRLRGSRALLAWRAAARLAASRIATAEPVAVVARGGEDYLVTRWVEGAVPLHRLLAERFGEAPPRGELAAKRRLLRGLGRWLRRIHDAGFYHNDWSAKNILAVEREGQWAFSLLDLESVTFYKWLTRRRRVKNLSQLNDTRAGVTATDRMRVLVAYAGMDRRLTRGAFPRRILAGTRRRVARRARR
ncbi:MAG: lipopolysaccharide kinase InaA family protein, partial [Planctomycetota bacterium]